MSDAIKGNDHNDVSSVLLSLSTGAAVPSDNENVPTSGDEANKETKPEESKPEAETKPAPEVATEKKEEKTSPAAAKEDNAKESLSEQTARHLDQANTVAIAKEAPEPPEAPEPAEATESPTSDPPKKLDREVESIVDGKPSEATAKSDEKDTSSDKPSAANKGNQDDDDDKMAAETNGGENETKEETAEEAAPKQKRKVSSKSVGSATSARSSERRKKVSAKSTLKAATLEGTWSEAETNEKKRKASETKKPAPTTKKRVKKPSASPAAAAGPRVGPKEVYSGPPDATDMLKDGAAWPAGWIKKRFQRQSGANKGRPDPYWYSPIENKKFRSMNEVNRFMDALKKTEGDELKAWEIFKKK